MRGGERAPTHIETPSLQLHAAENICLLSKALQAGQTLSQAFELLQFSMEL
jgi:hypothetical protein